MHATKSEAYLNKYTKRVLRASRSFIQIYPVSEGYLRKIPVERGKFACPRIQAAL
jgi:hypothetical protein